MNAEEIPVPNLFLDDLKAATATLIRERDNKKYEYEQFKKEHPELEVYLQRYRVILNSYDLAIEVMKLKIKELEGGKEDV